MPRDIKSRLVLEGEQTFRQAMTSASAAVKTLTAEEKAAEAQFKATGDAETYQSERARILREKMEEQKKAVEAAEKAVKQLTEQGVQKNDRAMQQWRTRLANAQTALAQTETKLQSLQGQIDNTSQTMDNGAQAAADYGAEIAGIGRQFSVEGAVRSIDRITDTVQSGLRTVSGLGRAIWQLEADAADWADEIITEAARAGVDVETYQAWQYAEQIIDTSIADILSAQTRLQGQVLRDSPQTAAALNAIGVAISDSAGNARSSEDVFWDTIEALGAIDDITERDARAQQIFGNSYRNLIPLLNQGRAAWDAAVAEGREHFTLTEDQVAALGELDDSFTSLGFALNSTKLEILSALAPVFKDIADAMTLAVNGFNDFLQTEEGQKAMQDLGDALSGLVEMFLDSGPDGFRSAVTTARDLILSLTGALNWIRENKDAVIAAILAIGGVLLGLQIAGAILKIIEFVMAIRGMSAKGKADWVNSIGDIIGGVFSDIFGGGDGGGGGSTGTPRVPTITRPGSDDTPVSVHGPEGGPEGDGTGTGTGAGGRNFGTVLMNIDSNVQTIRALLEPDHTPDGPQSVTFSEGDPALTALTGIETAINDLLTEYRTHNPEGPKPVTFSEGDPALTALTGIETAVNDLLVEYRTHNPEGSTPASAQPDLAALEGYAKDVSDWSKGDGAVMATDIGSIETHTDQAALTLVNIASDLERVAWWLENNGAIGAAARARAMGRMDWVALLTGGTAVSGYTGDWRSIGFMPTGASTGSGYGLRAGTGVSYATPGGYTWDPDQYEAELAHLAAYDLRDILTEETARMLYERTDAAGHALDPEQIVPQVLAELVAYMEGHSGDLPGLRRMDEPETPAEDVTPPDDPLVVILTGISGDLSEVLSLLRGDGEPVEAPTTPADDPILLGITAAGVKLDGIETAVLQILTLLTAADLSPLGLEVPVEGTPPVEDFFWGPGDDESPPDDGAADAAEEAGQTAADAAEAAGEAASDATDRAEAKLSAAHAATRGAVREFWSPFQDAVILLQDIVGGISNIGQHDAPDEATWGGADYHSGGNGSRQPNFIKDLDQYTRGTSGYGVGGRVSGAQTALIGEDGAEYIIPVGKTARAYDLTMAMLAESDALRARVAAALAGDALGMSAASARMSAAAGARAAGGVLQSLALAGSQMAAAGGGGSQTAGSGGVNATIYMDKRAVGYMVAETVNEVMGAKVANSRRGEA